MMTTNAYFSAIFEPPGLFPGQKNLQGEAVEN